MCKLTFSQFQASRTYSPDLARDLPLDVAFIDDSVVSGYIYMDSCYIIIGNAEADDNRWEYELIIGNEDVVSSDLDDLEEELYQWYMANHY